MADWEVTLGLCRGARLRHALRRIPSRDHGRDRAPDADLRRPVSYAKLERGWARSSGHAMPQRRKARRSCMSMRFVRGKGRFMITEYTCRPRSVPGERFPLLLTTGRILSQYNVGAQTRAHRRTPSWHNEDVLEIHPLRRREPRHPPTATGWLLAEPLRRHLADARSLSERVQPGVVYTTFHHAGRAAPTSSPPTTPTGPPTAPSTRSPRCNCRGTLAHEACHPAPGVAQWRMPAR
jgi:hypothetical protein